MARPGAGRIQGIRDGRAVESWFFPAADDEPYFFTHVLDEPATAEIRRDFGIEQNGTRVTVPLAERRLPPSRRLHALVANLVQLRPILEDPDRELYVELPDEPLVLVSYTPPEPDPERPLLLEREVTVQRGVSARIVVRRAAQAIPLGSSRATRRGGLVVRSGRAAHETTLAGLDGRPGARHLYGEVACDAIEEVQRKALDSPRPQVAVRVDRSGLNDNHPLVRRLYAEIERVLRPIVDEEERRAGARLVRSGTGGRGTRRDRSQSAQRCAARRVRRSRPDWLLPRLDARRQSATRGHPRAFARRSAPGRACRGRHRRGDAVQAVADPHAPGLPAHRLAAVRPFPSASRHSDRGCRRFRPLALTRASRGPEPGARGWARVSGSLRALVAAEPGSRLSVFAAAGGYDAELVTLIVRHSASGWVREIARKDDDSPIEAEFDPETGVVTVFEGRPEFKALERAARRAGLSKRRSAEYVPFRMLEVEVAANAVYAWAAERILERKLPGERPTDPAGYAEAVRSEAQALRHQFHVRLMRAFLEPEVFDGAVAVARTATGTPQLTLLEGT